MHFGNRKVTINPPYETKLLKSAREAKRIEDYDIQVGGYAATIGSVALNQQISEDRADSVATFLEGQTQNRRVVVRVLQNKGIAGLESPH